MQEIILDEEFKALLPALNDVAYNDLERTLLKHGLRDAIVLWDGILIDGYNRYSICLKHNLPYHTVSMEFESREEVQIWIIENQIARRNLTPMQLSHFRGLHYRADKILKGTYDRNATKNHKGQNDPYEASTASRLSKQYNVSPKTIKRNSKLSEAIDAIGEVSSEARRLILSGEVRVDKGVLEGLASASQSEIKEIAMQIENGTYERKQAKPLSLDIDDLTAIKPDFAGMNQADTSKMNPFEVAITRMSGELFAELNKQAKTGDKKELKTAIRSYIIMLEDFYSNI